MVILEHVCAPKAVDCSGWEQLQQLLELRKWSCVWLLMPAGHKTALGAVYQGLICR